MGKLSVKVIDWAILLFNELSMVNVNVDRSPKLTVLGAKLLVKPGRAGSTVKSADAVPLLPWLEVRSLLVFVLVPTVAEVTLTETVQTVLLETRPSVNDMVSPPSGATTNPLIHSDRGTPGEAMVTPAGKVLENVKSVAVVAEAELSMVKVKVEVLPTPMVSGVKFALNAG